eukprot:202702-Prymnesium_polylepis.1
MAWSVMRTRATSPTRGSDVMNARGLVHVRPALHDDLEVGAEARERVVPILRRVVARDAHVEHLIVLGLRVPAHRTAAPD